MRPDLQYYLSGGWTPRNIGKLVFWLDVEQRASLLLNGNAGAAIRDVVSGFTLTQAFGSARPTYSPTSFNGRPGLTFDGSDDCLEATGAGPLPTGTAPSEIWVLADQTAPSSNATGRVLFAVGNTTTVKRELARVVTSGTNRAQVSTYDGTSTQTAQETTVDYSGRKILRGIFAPTLLTNEIDGVVQTTAIAGNNTTSTRTRWGANVVGTAAQFWQGVGNTVLGFNALLNTNEANLVRAYLNRRRL